MPGVSFCHELSVLWLVISFSKGGELILFSTESSLHVQAFAAAVAAVG